MNKSYLMNRHSRAEYLGSSQEAQEKRNKGYEGIKIKTIPS